ncbi:MAG: prepilin-type N-terminal cleavage/methylation domain-containing protein [Phycisphaerae bacterium]|nr:prepilin-type N-terminal cleavage/methylation domain-containing protein [Phycisphaerae bacterium]
MNAMRRTDKGFTLLEMLAAMSLMVAVAACLYSSLYTAFRARRSAESALNPTLTAWRAIELLKQDLSGALPPTGILAGGFLGTDAHDGKGYDTDSVILHTTYVHTLDDALSDGISMVELVMEEDAGSRRLVRRVTTNLLSPRAVESATQILCRGVRSLNIRYFDGYSWRDEWDSAAYENTLPAAIELDLLVECRPQGAAAELPVRRLTASFPLPCGVSLQAEGDVRI